VQSLNVKKAFTEAALLTETAIIDDPEQTDAVLTELAALEPVEYDQRRKAAADELGIREATLDAEVEKRQPARPDTKGGSKLDIPTPEPWPEPVDGERLADELTAAFERYLILPPTAADVLALWVVHTHVFQSFYITPRLAITSPEKECGKTTTLEVLSRLTAKPFSASNISAPAFFKALVHSEAVIPVVKTSSIKSTFFPENIPGFLILKAS